MERGLPFPDGLAALERVVPQEDRREAVDVARERLRHELPRNARLLHTSNSFEGQLYLQTLIVCKLGSNQNNYTFT